MIEDFSIEEVCVMEDNEIAEHLQEDIDYIMSKIAVIRQKKKVIHETGLGFFYKEDESSVLVNNNVANTYNRWVALMDVIENDLIPKVLTLKLFEEFSEYYMANESWIA